METPTFYFARRKVSPTKLSVWFPGKKWIGHLHQPEGATNVYASDLLVYTLGLTVSDFPNMETAKAVVSKACRLKLNP